MKRAFQGICVGGLGLLLGAGIPMVRTLVLRRGVGLSQADRQRILSNGLAEALYDAVFTALLFVAIWVVVLLVRPLRRPPGPPEGGG